MILEKNAWKNVDIASIAALTEGFSGSDLQRACVHATKKMLRKRVAIKYQHQRNTPSRHSTSRSMSISRYRNLYSINQIFLFVIKSKKSFLQYLISLNVTIFQPTLQKCGNY